MAQVTTGPLALQTSLLVALGAAALGAAVGHGIARSDGVRVGGVLWLVAGIAVLAARAAFVGPHWNLYADAPWRLVDLRDGGCRPALGVAAALAAGAWLAWRRPAQRKALLAGVLTGSLLWVIGTALLNLRPSAERPPVVSVLDQGGRPPMTKESQ